MSDIYKIREEEIPLFRDAIAHNRKHVRSRLAKHKWPDGQMMYTVTFGEDGYLQLVQPGQHHCNLMRKNDDLLPAALIGALVIDALHGHDAILIKGGEACPIELKLTFTYRDKYWVTKRGSINSGTKNDKAHKVCFRSGLAGNYEIKHNLGSKNVDTYLLAFDMTTYEVIDCFTLAGEEVVRRLKTNSNTNSTRNTEISNISLKLSTFMKSGKRVYVGPCIGVEQYEEQLRSTAPVVEQDATPPKSTQKAPPRRPSKPKKTPKAKSRTKQNAELRLKSIPQVRVEGLFDWPFV